MPATQGKISAPEVAPTGRSYTPYWRPAPQERAMPATVP